MTDETFDVIVVGAGSAGAALAARLSEKTSRRVLLLEAGPVDKNPWLHIPIGYAKTVLDPKVNWKYETEPQAELNGRKIYWPRGKVLGGTSAINGLVYMRGLPSDYDHWRQLGNRGWGWLDVLPHFIKAEGNERGADALHGAEGPLGVQDARWQTPLSEAFIAAAQQAGLPANLDFNGPSQEGVGYYQHTLRGGRRSSSAAYLRQAKGRNNLVIQTDALVERVLLDGRRAVGVTYRKGGQTITARAREIVLSGGAINSPQLLLLSGIGPAEQLKSHGLAVALDLAGVGENLQDHLQGRGLYRLKRKGTMNDRTQGLFNQAMIALDYLVRKKGPLALGAGLVGVFARSPGAEEPDLQMHFIPFTTDRLGTGLHPFPGFTLTVNHSRPFSRGWIRLKSADPTAHPEIQPNYLSAEEDRRSLLAGLRWIRRITRQPALKDWLDHEMLPGDQAESDDELMAFARQYAGTIYHPTGTCKMGPASDRLAVVDERLKVHGTQGLRVADASIMPTLVSGNTNAPCVMIGEKAAVMIAEDLG